MHHCELCDEPCYCDLEDTDLGTAPADCDHRCPDDEDGLDYGADEDDDAAPRQEDGK